MTSASDALRSDLAHLYRRAGFGATPAELDAAVTAGYAATVAALVRPPSASDQGVLATPPPQLTVAQPPGKDQTAAERKAYRAQVVKRGTRAQPVVARPHGDGDESVSGEADVFLARTLRNGDVEGAQCSLDAAPKRVAA